MAAEKTTKRRQRAPRLEGARERPPAKAEPSTPRIMLRLRKDPREERRFEPITSTSAWISVLGLSIASVLLGAGVYGQWLRSSIRPEFTEPHPYASYLLLAGALLLAGFALFGPRPARPIRVGDAGIGVEKDGGDLDRIEWRDVTRILLGGDSLSFQGPGTVVAIPLKQHPQAAARAVAEARARIPTKLEEVDTAAVPKLDEDAGELIPLEKPQLAGSRCKASDELIAFEKDARLCGSCGEVYHKEHVPERCLTCDAQLR